MRIIVGISGATGAQMGYRFLQVLQQFPNIETHLVVTEGAKVIFQQETDIPLEEVLDLADVVHDNKNMGASISSGSFKTDGMVVIPCSMKSLSAIANAYNSELLVRAADVCLKENRRVVLVPREMPMNRTHLRNMMAASEAGCVIIPPVLTFYSHYPTVDDQVDHIIGKVLMQFGLDFKGLKPWTGNTDICLLHR